MKTLAINFKNLLITVTLKTLSIIKYVFLGTVFMTLLMFAIGYGLH